MAPPGTIDKDEIIAHDFRKFLEKAYQSRKMKRPSYSFRSFAKLLSIDPTTLRKLILGKRPLGAAVIRRLGQTLALSSAEIERYIVSHNTRRAMGTLATDPIKPVYTELDELQLRAMANWQSYALLELMDLERFIPEPAWIAEVLKITEKEIEEVIANLLQIGWLAIDADGKWVKNPNPTTADPKDPKSAALRHLLMQNILDKACSSLTNVPRDRRTFQAQTFAIDESLLPEAVEKIRAFRTELNHLLQKKGARPNQVYGLITGLYPLSHLATAEK
jgi:uncharacterized protein (TIGR02147 family)